MNYRTVRGVKDRHGLWKYRCAVCSRDYLDTTESTNAPATCDSCFGQQRNPLFLKPVSMMSLDDLRRRRRR